MFRISAIIFIFLISFSNALANTPGLFRLEAEPTIRIGLATNVRSVAISTVDSQLTAASADETQKYLAVNKINVSARAYRPPETEVYNLEIAGIATQTEAEQIAKDVCEATNEAALVMPDAAASNLWRIRIGEQKPTLEEAADFKETLGEKGFDTAAIVTEKIKQPSTDALELSRKVQLTVLTSANVLPPVVDPNLREVIVNGAGETAKFTSLKPVSFGSTNDRNVPVRVNGKAYRGRIEVFVNSRGSLTVVNTVKLEDYLRGVVPNELGFPALEAQKAQAVAARTYAVKNIGQFGR